MAQAARERETTQAPQVSAEDMVEVWVNIHGTDITVPILVKRNATLPEILEAIQAYYVSLGGTFESAGSQVLLNDHTYVIDAKGEITGDFTYTIHENSTLTLTRRITGGCGRVIRF